MKKFLLPLLAVLTVPAFAASINIDNISKDDLKKVGNEFAMNFSHTTVAAPETDGLWGVEVGALGGKTGSPNLKDVVNNAGGSGNDFKTLYHAAAFARVHIPFDLFAEATILPKRDISDVSVSSNSFGVGWNVGAFLGLPIDIAVGYNTSSSDISFDQTINNTSTSNTDVDSTIKVATKSQVAWVGVSKTFLFITPYVKVGNSHSDSQFKIDTNGAAGTVFAFTNRQKEDVSANGGFLATGANIQLAFFKIGAEFSQTARVKRASAKISIDF